MTTENDHAAFQTSHTNDGAPITTAGDLSNDDAAVCDWSNGLIWGFSFCMVLFVSFLFLLLSLLFAATAADTNNKTTKKTTKKNKKNEIATLTNNTNTNNQVYGFFLGGLVAFGLFAGFAFLSFFFLLPKRGCGWSYYLAWMAPTFVAVKDLWKPVIYPYLQDCGSHYRTCREAVRLSSNDEERGGGKADNDEATACSSTLEDDY